MEMYSFALCDKLRGPEMGGSLSHTNYKLIGALDGKTLEKEQDLIRGTKRQGRETVREKQKQFLCEFKRNSNST